MPSLQEVEQFKYLLNELGDEPEILAEQDEQIEDILPPEQHLPEGLSDLLETPEGAPGEPGPEAGPGERSVTKISRGWISWKVSSFPNPNLQLKLLRNLQSRKLPPRSCLSKTSDWSYRQLVHRRLARPKKAPPQP
jgi:hypothetical protein